MSLPLDYNVNLEKPPAIHATAFVGDGVELGDGVAIGPGAVILGPTRIGDRVWIGPGVMIGGPPEISSLRQNSAWTGDLDHAGVIIGDDTVIRERSVIHQGSARPTVVGNHCWLLNGAYLAHDVQLGDHVTISAGVSIGGHVSVGDRVTVGMNAVIHQRRSIAPGAMVGMGTVLTRDVPPFAKVYGVPPRLHGANAVGMSRLGIDAAAVDALVALYAAGSTTFVGDLAGTDLEPLTAHIAWWSAVVDVRAVRAGDEADLS